MSESKGLMLQLAKLLISLTATNYATSVVLQLYAHNLLNAKSAEQAGLRNLTRPFSFPSRVRLKKKEKSLATRD